MGLEYKIKAHDLCREVLPDFLRRHPDFAREENGAFHLGLNSDFTVTIEEDHIYACQHVASQETNALLGLLLRRVLSHNENVTIEEL